MVQQVIATKETTVAALLDAAGREHLPLSNAFLQTKARSGQARPGVAAAFVHSGAVRPLMQYLLVHAVASGTDFGVARDSRIWARALGLDHSVSASRTAVSKNWGWLERHKLIRRERRGRLSKIVLLRDDGSGKAYKHPVKLRQGFFQLPFAFWREGWDAQLDLPSAVLLLIALSLGDGFILPHSQVQAWYGISSSTLTKGVAGLRGHGLLEVRRDRKEAPLAPEGYTWEYSYTLKSPFGPKGTKSAAAMRRLGERPGRRSR